MAVPEAANAPWRASVLTLLPAAFPGPLGLSNARRALDRGLWSLETHDIRDFSADKHRTVDGAPAGGGPGMVLRADVTARAIDAARPQGDTRPLLVASARGRPFDQAFARELAHASGLVILCGRFEGIDQRVIEARQAQEVSIGDYVLSGGEIAALAIIDSVVRLLPGVMGHALSGTEESFEDGLLEYPQFTLPRTWEGRAIPEVLLSGDHGKVARWRRAEAEKATRQRRPDLWNRQGE
ncbi:MAG: tRNA (guanosine(37)-N1)-methyltransferase TrmD [Rhizobiales bacterium]|nr:tRNA (guanosine(37)-N1)-methyltransferase TrmD [Hyphomicrobiales bacterium]